MPLINVPGTQQGLTITLTGLEPQTIGAIPASEKGQPQGVATLGNDGVVLTNQLPNYHVPTLAELGGIPLSQKGTPNGIPSLDDDSKVPYTQLPGSRVYRSTNKPTSPNEGDIWRQQDPNFGTNLHRWIYTGGLWRSEDFLTQSKLYWVSTPNDDLVHERNWEVDIYPKLPFTVDKIFLAYLRIGFTCYAVTQTPTNYWRFIIFGMDGNNTENYWNEINFPDNIPLFGRSEKTLQINAHLAPWSELRRVRIVAEAVGNPGLILAWSALSYFFTRS